MRKLVSILILSAFAVPAVHAASLELTLNDDVAQFLVTSTGNRWGMDNTQVGGGILFNENDDLLGTVRLLSTNRVSPSLRFAVGVQGYLGDLDRINETASAIAVGGNVGIGLAAQIPVSLVLEGWVAPSILSFGDTEKTKEWSARIEAAISRQAAVFFGYRKLEIEVENRGDYELDDSANFGVRLTF